MQSEIGVVNSAVNVRDRLGGPCGALFSEILFVCVCVELPAVCLGWNMGSSWVKVCSLFERWHKAGLKHHLEVIYLPRIKLSNNSTMAHVFLYFIPALMFVNQCSVSP